MECGKRPATTESNSLDKKTIRDLKRNNEGANRKGRTSGSSLIPKPKADKQEPKVGHRNQTEYDVRLRSLQEKEKSVSEYFAKLEDLILKTVEKKEETKARTETLKPKTPSARKMTSDPVVFIKQKVKEDALSDFEKDVQQISNIWLKTSADLTNALKVLQNSPSLDPVQFEMESNKIQLAIKQARSLTLVKTRNVLEEAKHLVNHRELIRTELEKFLGSEGNLNSNNEVGKRRSLQERTTYREVSSQEEQVQRTKTGGKGDTPDKMSLGLGKDTISEEKDKSEERSEGSGAQSSSSSGEEERTWAAELAKKNETITQLHNKIFELQKACNEHSLKYSQLEMKLAEFHEKIQWDQVLWKQIGKLKDLIKGLQHNNKLLESQKRDLEYKIVKLDKELERLLKLNHVLTQQKYLLKSAEEDGPENSGEEKKDDLKRRLNTPEKILEEKQNLIEQLTAILGLMKEQENVAQKQIAIFQSKIAELGQNSKT